MNTATTAADTTSRSNAALIRLVVSAAVTIAGSWLTIREEIKGAAREQAASIREEVRAELADGLEDIGQDLEDQLDQIRAEVHQDNTRAILRIDSIGRSVTLQVRAMRDRTPVDSF